MPSVRSKVDQRYEALRERVLLERYAEALVNVGWQLHRFTFEVADGEGSVQWWGVGRTFCGTWEPLGAERYTRTLDSLDDCFEMIAAWLLEAEGRSATVSELRAGLELRDGRHTSGMSK